jgi:hypothetical protein
MPPRNINWLTAPGALAQLAAYEALELPCDIVLCSRYPADEVAARVGFVKPVVTRHGSQLGGSLGHGGGEP